jgi:hypothetical protein
MKHNIIKTENYLLVVDDSKIKGDDIVLVNNEYHTNDIRKFTTALGGKSEWCKKITAHLPLNNSPILEGVPLLPPLENEVEEVWEQGLGAEIEKLLPYMKHLDDGQYNSGQLVGFEIGSTWGYNKAKEKYKYTEEDILEAMEIGFDIGKNFDDDNPNTKLGWLVFQKDNFIQSLQQPKMPVAFECEMYETQVRDINTHELIKGRKKTTTNPQGQTGWVGKYIY